MHAFTEAGKPDVGAGEFPDAGAELGHCAVVLGAAEEPHVRVGQALRHRQRLGIRAHKCACTQQSNRWYLGGIACSRLSEAHPSMYWECPAHRLNFACWHDMCEISEPAVILVPCWHEQH
jgi:hypothetical protein